METVNIQNTKKNNKETGFIPMVIKDFKKYKYLYLMILPVIIYYVVFHYAPLYGATIAFKNFSPSKGIMGSPWVGFKHFKSFLTSFYFWRVFRNTLMINLIELIFAFPAPIILALLLNEIKNNAFKRTIQTITYMPHFISLVVVCGMIVDFTSSEGVINSIITSLGGQKIMFLQKPEYFRSIYVSSGIWQGIGWGSIIYLAALSAIDPSLYEAAIIDGAGRFKQLLHVTLPGIAPTIVILLILNLGKMMNVGFEKIILLYNPATYETADVISSFVYRRGLREANWSFGSAVGLLNSVINLVLITMSNKISRKLNETSLW